MQRQDAGAETPDTIVMSRTFDAPRELLFDAWTDPALLARWFGPRGAELRVLDLDARPGGALRFCHRFPDGMEVWVRATYTEVVRPERLVFTHAFTDADGRRSGHPMFPDWPLELACTTTVTFEEDGAGTRLTIAQGVTPASAARRQPVRRERQLAREGWASTLDRLADTLAAAS